MEENKPEQEESGESMGENSSHRRSIRDIKKGAREKLSVRRSASETPQHLARTGRGYKSRKRTAVAVWFVGIILLLFVFFGVSAIFDGADITITPRTAEATIEESFTSYIQAPADELQHDVMTLTEEMSVEVSASGEEHVEQRASGIITVFNNFDENDQTLITRTRFEAPNGRVYRIDGPITVPGQKVVDGETVPGSVSVRVYADEPGEEHNIGKTEFTIPGFEGDPRYDAFSATSETAMTGGFVGTQRTVEDEDLESAEAELLRNLETELISLAEAQVPEGYTFFEALIVTEFEDLPNTNTDDPNTVEIIRRGVLRAAIFNTEELARHLAMRTISNYDGAPITLTNPGDLVLAPDEGTDLLGSDTLSFTLSGNPHLRFLVDTEKIKESILGIRRVSLDSILDDYTGIEKADVTIKPFWKRSIPDNSRDVDVEVLSPEQNS